MIKLGLGTGNLKEKFNNDYYNLFEYSVENQNLIHSAINYSNTQQYFRKIYKNNQKIPKVIFKIELKKNPIKKITYIQNQIEFIMNSYNLESIDSIQLCNNPNSNYLNILLIKKIFKKYIDKKLIKNIYIESFRDFGNNLSNLVKDDFFKGFIFTLNLSQRGCADEFFKKINLEKKNFVVISPFNKGQIGEELKKININFFQKIFKIKKANNYNELNKLNIAFLKNFNNCEYVITGTKKIENFKNLENQFKIIEKITDETKNEILNLQTSYPCENIY